MCRQKKEDNKIAVDDNIVKDNFLIYMIDDESQIL